MPSPNAGMPAPPHAAGPYGAPPSMPQPGMGYPSTGHLSFGVSLTFILKGRSMYSKYATLVKDREAMIHVQIVHW